jgi:hypothetical protein
MERMKNVGLNRILGSDPTTWHSVDWRHISTFCQADSHPVFYTLLVRGCERCIGTEEGRLEKAS